jgi:hypothetical protein
MSQKWKKQLSDNKVEFGENIRTTFFKDLEI